MPASKRRRAAASRRTAAMESPAAPTAIPDPVVAPQRQQPAASRRARVVRATASTDPDEEPSWSPLGLLALLTLVFAIQLPVGAVIHLISHANLLIIDLFFFQAQYVLLASFLAMPIARILTHQPRPLRLLESLSLGAVYALLALLLTTVFVHPNTGSVSSDQFMRHLQVGDGLRIAFSDVLALFGTVAFFPSINRVLSAPGRRARRRMVQRGAPGPRAGGARKRNAGVTGKPKR